MQHIRKLHEFVSVSEQILFEVIQGFEVGIHALFLRVGYKDHSIDSLENQLAGRFIKNLSGNGVEMKASLEAADRPQLQGHEIKEQRSIGFGCETNQLTPGLRGGRIVDVLKIRGLAAESGAVIDDLAVDLTGRVVDQRHVARALLFLE